MTVEEKIISHIEQNCTYPDGSPMMDEQTFYEGAKWGYNEAMRWRTFDEKPIIHTWILVRPKLYPIFKPKVKRVDVFVDLSKKYTHWKPIE